MSAAGGTGSTPRLMGTDGSVLAHNRNLYQSGHSEVLCLSILLLPDATERDCYSRREAGSNRCT